MKSISVAFLFAAVLLQVVSAQVPINGTCEGYCKGNGTKNASDYLGIWYLQQLTPNLISEKFKCSYLNASSVEGDVLIANLHTINLSLVLKYIVLLSQQF